MAEFQPLTPRNREEEEHLLSALRESARLGTPLHLQSTPFTVSPEAVAGATMTGPRRYMVRRRRIEQGIDALLATTRDAWRALARHYHADPAAFAHAWTAAVTCFDVTELNRLIDAHNCWYPAEANLPMSIHTGDYITPDGRDYREELIDARWFLTRFPADLAQALASSTEDE